MSKFSTVPAITGAPEFQSQLPRTACLKEGILASHSTENPVASDESASVSLGAVVRSPGDSASTMQLPNLHVSDIVRFMH